MDLAGDTQWLAMRLAGMSKNGAWLREQPRPHSKCLDLASIKKVADDALATERQASEGLVTLLETLARDGELSADGAGEFVRSLGALQYCNGVSGVGREKSICGFQLCPFDHAVRTLAAEAIGRCQLCVNGSE